MSGRLVGSRRGAQVMTGPFVGRPEAYLRPHLPPATPGLRVWSHSDTCSSLSFLHTRKKLVDMVVPYGVIYFINKFITLNTVFFINRVHN